MHDRFLTVDESCDYLHISRATLYRLVERGELKRSGTVGSRMRFSKHTLHEYVQSNQSPLLRGIHTANLQRGARGFNSIEA